MADYPIFRNYLEDEDDKPYFHMNTLAFYYEDMERKQKLIEDLARKIVGYDLKLTGNLEEVEKEVALKLSEFDAKVDTLPATVNDLLEQWVDDGSIKTIIDSTIVDEKLAPLNVKLAEKVGGQRKLLPEEFSDEAMALVTGNGTVNVLSIPQNESVDLTKTIKPIRDILRPKNISLPFSKVGEGIANDDTIYTNKGLYRLSRWYNVGGVSIANDKISFASKTGNLFWVDHHITDEFRKWGTLSFGITMALSAGVVGHYLRFYNSSDSIISSHTAVLSGNLSKLEGVSIPADATYIRIYANATSTATGEIHSPILTFGSILGEYDLTYFNSIFNPEPTIIQPKAVSFNELSDEVSDTINENNGFNQWNGVTAAFLGDSITSQVYNADKTNRFPKVLCERFAMTELNYGISSSTIAVNEADTVQGDPMVTRFQNMDNAADLIIVAGGTNDWFYARVPVGTMADRTNFTFYGAMHNLCIGLKKKYIGKTILFMLPIMRRQLSYQTPDSVNKHGKSLKQYAAMIKEVCDYYSIPTVDMFRESGLFPFDDELALAYYTQQGTEGAYYYTHPNDAGQLMIAKRLIGFVNQLG